MENLHDHVVDGHERQTWTSTLDHGGTMDCAIHSSQPDSLTSESNHDIKIVFFKEKGKTAMDVRRCRCRV